MMPEIPLWVKNPDYDRLDWLNTFVESMWPYLNKAICKTIKETTKPYFEEYIGKYNIKLIDYETLTLGSLPPTFQGMKVYNTEDKEIIMEIPIKWAANPNITVAVEGPCGLKATVQVVDLQVFTVARVTLKPLLPAFPCFAKIIVSLMEKPYVDFGLKLVGVDLMSIPGLYRYVQETIKDQVASMYLWPKTLEVQIMDPSKAMQRPVGIVNIKVIRAMRLRKKDFMGKSDPYVKLKLSGDKLPGKKTTVKHNNLNPEWNEEFSMTVRDPENQELVFRVNDWEQVGRHDKLGMASIPLKDLTPEDPKVFTFDLSRSLDAPDPPNEKSRGQLIVEVTYNPYKEEDMAKDFLEDPNVVEKAPENTPEGGGLLVVIIHEAQDLEGKHHTNPYAKIIFRGEEKKTKPVKKNRDPRWEEEFHFMLEEPPVDDKLHIDVFSKASGIIHSKEVLGYVDIGLGDVVNNRRINEKYHLIDSKNGRIQVEMQWRT